MRRLIILVILITFLTKPMENAFAEQKIERTITLESLQKDFHKNSDFLILSYKWSSLNSQIETTEEAINELTVPDLQTTPLLPTDMDYFLTFYPDYDKLMPEEQDHLNQIITTQIQINYSLNQMIELDNRQAIAERDSYIKQLEEQRKNLQEAIKELAAQKEITSIQEQEALIGAKLYIETLFVAILSYKDQLAIYNLELEEAKGELDKYKRLVELGQGTEYSMVELRAQVKLIEHKLEHAQDQYDLYLTQLLIDLNYDLNGKYTIERIHIPPVKEISELSDGQVDNIANRFFSMRIMAENISLAKLKHSSSSGKLKDHAYYHLKMLQEQRVSLKKDLKKKVYEKYQKYSEMLNDYNRIKEVYQSLLMENEFTDRQFLIGLISEHEKEKINRKLDKIHLELLLKENALFIGEKEIDAMVFDGYMK